MFLPVNTCKSSRTLLSESILIYASAELHCLAGIGWLHLPSFCPGCGINSRCCALTLLSIFCSEKVQSSLKSQESWPGAAWAWLSFSRFRLSGEGRLQGFIMMMVSKVLVFLSLISPSHWPWTLPAKNCLLSEPQCALQLSCPRHLQLSPSILLPEFASWGAILSSQVLFILVCSQKTLPLSPFTASLRHFMAERGSWHVMENLQRNLSPGFQGDTCIPSKEWCQDGLLCRSSIFTIIQGHLPDLLTGWRDKAGSIFCSKSF